MDSIRWMDGLISPHSQIQVKTLTIHIASTIYLTVALAVCSTIMLSHSLFKERALARLY